MSDNIYKVDFADQNVSKEITNFPNLDWVVAGIKILREHGIMGISIETVCKELNRDESDFNKVFNGLESFAFAILDFWYEKETLRYIDIMDDIDGSAEETLLTLVEILHGVDKKDELAIRNWALMCPNAHKALARVDKTRLDFGTGLFKEMGFSETESTLRSRIFYTSTIGTEYTSISSSLEQKLATCKLLVNQD